MPHQSDDPALNSVAWLAGSWGSGDGKNSSEEVWTRPLGGTMFGVNRTVREGETVFYEYLCIQNTPDGIFYLASPKGRQPPTPFKMVSTKPINADEFPSVIFENPEHDFPTRIVYQLIGDILHVHIKGTRNGQPACEEWTWRRVK